MFPHHSIQKYTWLAPDGKTHNQIDHILVDRGRHSIVLDVRSFRAADCDSDHYLVVAKIRERLAANEQRSQTFDMERFNLRKLNHAGSKEVSLVFLHLYTGLPNCPSLSDALFKSLYVILILTCTLRDLTN
jgi:hypothetical protein